MKSLLKFLIPILFFAAFPDAVGKLDDFAVREVAVMDSLSPTDSDYSPPRHVSLSCSARVHSNTRRTDNVQRSHLEFIRSGKSFNASVIYCLWKSSVVVSTSASCRSNKLAYLGKLIL